MKEKKKEKKKKKKKDSSDDSSSDSDSSNSSEDPKPTKVLKSKEEKKGINIHEAPKATRQIGGVTI